ncbi:hypothetical protein BJ322DRAFT_1070651 [Thelephora terrestris]|uniref:DUF6535 domain-containing protein n=1 Tax=Thelephora terrestris TaxID=56493 RepID=A0A9P6L5G7_9AGAM|nr:hypothetical protein BJ322DRAFT_1070651 [Thelephora terrestris]
MSDEESPKPVNVDPRCFQEALRMYLQPIKNDDPQLDFYTMYKRETLEYDTEYMNKYNEDLNTTLIFAGLFSAVSSAFVIAIQPELQPDPGQQSEAYLRAILLTLNPSISPDEHPAAPPAWSGPLQEIITTLDLLYASLLMSLLAAFVAMLGKQWLNRYLRHAGGSVIERCGDRQRKFDGLEKWPFRVFIESLPIILQIALFLLASGLSRYVWSINTSVSAVIISLTVLGFLFYTVIVVIGTSSYDCPFQTPLSTALRGVLPLFSASNLNSFIRATQGNGRSFLQNLPQPNVPSLIYAAWIDTRQELVSTLRRAHQAIRSHSSLNSPSRIVSDVRGQIERFGHHIIVPFLPIYRVFGRAKQRLAQTLRGFRGATILPVASGDTIVQRPVRQNRTGTGLRIHVWNFETLRRQNTDNARCVCWVLRNITDPEAIDAAIRLAGNIRWFDANSKHDPPFDLIVSIFEACFDSTKEVYPGMRDRAYFSARAILQIHAMARIQSEDYALKYPVPTAFPESVQTTDPDLRNVLDMLQSNTRKDRPTLRFPVVKPHTHAHLLWMSNLFLDLTRVGPNPILDDYYSYLGVAASGSQAAISNTLIVWYMLLGGDVEEETFWATDKSDSLEPIFSLLAPRVKNDIADGCGLSDLDFLLKFLEAWDKRPAFLAPMAYQWCSTLFKEAGKLHESDSEHLHAIQLQLRRLAANELFREVGGNRDRFHSGGTPLHFPMTRKVIIDSLSRILTIVFRQVDPDPDHIPEQGRRNHCGRCMHLDWG